MKTSETEEKRVRVATDVMGWVRATTDWAYSDQADVWRDKSGHIVMTCYAWRPDEDDTHFGMLCDQLAALGFDVSLQVQASQAEVRIIKGQETIAVSRSDTRRLALLNAAVKVVEKR
ncbi:MAG: hypothetical protein AAF493_25570 [Pseudomonadota bacterium]